MSVAPSLFGALQFLLIRRDGLQRCPLGGIAVNRAEVRIRTFSRGRTARFQIRAATNFHQRARLHVPEQFAAIFIRKRTADRRLLLHKFVPDFVVIGDDIESWRQSEIMTVALQQSDTEGVNGAEKSAVERG